MSLQFFVCFHQKIFPEIYKISSKENKKYLTYYGVKNKDVSLNKNVIYEYELTHYNHKLQENKYNEGSCIYHIYKNDLHIKYDYIGFCQYDMIFPQSFFKNIKHKLSQNTIFYLDFFQWAFLGGQIIIITNYDDLPAGLDNYNKFFGTNHKPDVLLKNKMITCNTFLIPTKMYVKMMSWLIQYYKDNINIQFICANQHKFNPGHIIEALTSMFLALEICEGAVYEKLYLKHNHKYKI